MHTITRQNFIERIETAIAAAPRLDPALVDDLRKVGRTATESGVNCRNCPIAQTGRDPLDEPSTWNFIGAFDAPLFAEGIVRLAHYEDGIVEAGATAFAISDN